MELVGANLVHVVHQLSSICHTFVFIALIPLQCIIRAAINQATNKPSTHRLPTLPNPPHHTSSHKPLRTSSASTSTFPPPVSTRCLTNSTNALPTSLKSLSSGSHAHQQFVSIVKLNLSRKLPFSCASSLGWKSSTRSAVGRRSSGPYS